MSKPQTIKADSHLRAITGNPDGYLALSVQKSKKTYQNVYLDPVVTIANIKSKGIWVHAYDITLTGGVISAEKAQEKYKNDHEKRRMQVTTTVSNSGPMGAYCTALTPVFDKEVRRLATVDKLVVIGKKTICGFAQTHVADESPNIELRGQPIEDPVIRFKVVFDAPREQARKDFPWGKTVTQFFDYTKPYEVKDKDGNPVKDKDGNPVIKYSAMKVADENGNEHDVDASNVHKVLSAGTIIRDAIIYFENPNISQNHISSKMVLTNCVIETVIGSGGEDVEPDFGDEPTTTTTTATQTVEKTVEEKKEASGDAIGDLLDAI